MSGSTQPVKSMLDVDGPPKISSSQYHDQSYQEKSRNQQQAQHQLQSQPQDGTNSNLSSSTYALFRPQTPPAQNGLSNGTSAQRSVGNLGEQYSSVNTRNIELQTQYSQPQVESEEINAKDALSPIAGPPVNGSMNGQATTATTKETGVLQNVTQKANLVAANALQQANMVAINTADRLQATAQDTAEAAKQKVLANPTVLQTTETLRENFSADSHEMAHKDYGIQGAVQKPQGVPIRGVRDIGWHRPVVEIPDPLIGGLPNGNLFSLIRRFNKDVFDVRAVPPEIARGLDLNEAWSDEHATDKITLHLERLYISMVLGMVSFGKQVSRLRSWKETRRTGTFCAVYFTAWIFDLLMPLVLATLIVVVSSKEARDTLFPPAPLALVNISTGGIQKPQAGQLGTSNTITGAPEKQEGEAVEEEAANFVSNIRHIIGRAIGMHSEQQSGGDPLEGKVPKPIRNVAKNIKAAGAAPGHASDTKDQTQKPMEELLWDKANPKVIEPAMKAAPHVVGEIVDNWERFANAISPTPPFNRLTFLRIDAILVPAFLGALFINYYMVNKGIGFAIGFGLFGDPVLTPSLQWLNKNIPNWMELLEPKNNILRGVPTNNQLTLTLLRIGEANKTPIPPVPSSKPDDPDRKQLIDPDDIPLDATDAEISHATEPSGALPKTVPQDDQPEDAPKHKKLSKIMRVLKGNTKASVDTKLAVDHVRAKLGSEKAKGHLGVLPKAKNLVYAGPSEYKARYEGKKGWIYVTESSVVFCTGEQGDSSNPAFEIPLKNIKRLKRAAAFANKAAEVAANWGTEDELLGSVEIDDLNEKTWRFTALPERDELFNRLVSIGPQRWENI